MVSVTRDEIAGLEQMLEQYHARHAAIYGSMDGCTEPKCVEVKMGIAWLKFRVESVPPPPNGNLEPRLN